MEPRFPRTDRRHAKLIATLDKADIYLCPSASHGNVILQVCCERNDRNLWLRMPRHRHAQKTIERELRRLGINVDALYAIAAMHLGGK